jgi:hypothetical protein
MVVTGMLVALGVMSVTSMAVVAAVVLAQTAAAEGVDRRAGGAGDRRGRNRDARPDEVGGATG